MFPPSGGKLFGLKHPLLWLLGCQRHLYCSEDILVLSNSLKALLPSGHILAVFVPLSKAKVQRATVSFGLAVRGPPEVRAVRAVPVVPAEVALEE